MSTTAAHDPALDTLLLPFTAGHLPFPQDAVFLRARAGAALSRAAWPNLVCEQTFKPFADALLTAGFHVTTADTRYDVVLVLPPRQRDEARALYARATQLLRPGGRIVASVANNEGARSSEADLERLAGALSTLSKNKCRVFWTAPIDAPNQILCEEWLKLDHVRAIANGQLMSRPGVFAWDRIDPASALLANHLPNDLSGTAADLGAGIGYLSMELLKRCPRVRAVDLYEAESRALELARVNLESFAADRRIGFHWHDVTQGLPQRYDVIVSNPPFHAQTAWERPDIGRRFIAVAAQSLRPGGSLWLVANRHLPYESVLGDAFTQMRIVTQSQGFKIVSAVKSA